MPRPVDPAELLTLPITHNDWVYEQQGYTRFFLTNVETVFRACSLNANRVRDVIVSSEALLETSGWDQLYEEFEWNSFARTQVDRLSNDQGPYLFERACRVILAIEAAAARSGAAPSYDVYDHLRIIPAVFILNDFTKDTLVELRAQDSAFDEKFLRSIRQRVTKNNNKNILSQLANGRRVTAYVCTELKKYIANNHPTVNPGDLQYSDIDAAIYGNYHAAKSLRVPTKLSLLDIAAERRAIGL